MPLIRIQGTDINYDESDIITFDEGLIGFPQLRRLVLVRQADITPFLWLASLDDSRIAFLVVDPDALFPEQGARLIAALSEEDRGRLRATADDFLLTLSIVRIETDWTQSTLNLRAPLFISAGAMRGAQIALTESAYRLDEPLPLAASA